MVGRFLAEVRAAVDAHLCSFFERKLACAAAIDPACAIPVEAVRDLTMRGGKRMRPALVCAGFRAVTGTSPPPEVFEAAGSVELLQTYLLIQDDWMDGDVIRRGGPAVHAVLRQAYADWHLADSAALLASDLASSWAEEILCSSSLPAANVRAALMAYASAHQDVILGQFLDVTGSGSLEAVHQLKTAAYTVQGPLRIGAELAGGQKAQIDALDRFGRPIGIAFQLRDDVLGTFGDPEATGKGTAGDLRAGKRTAVLVEARRRLTGDALGQLDAVWGYAAATDAQIEGVRRLVEASGTRTAIEGRISALVAESAAALETAAFDEETRRLLSGLGERLVCRDR